MASYSCFDPSHQWMRSGRHIRAISSTHRSRAGCLWSPLVAATSIVIVAMSSPIPAISRSPLPVIPERSEEPMHPADATKPVNSREGTNLRCRAELRSPRYSPLFHPVREAKPLIFSQYGGLFQRIARNYALDKPMQKA